MQLVQFAADPRHLAIEVDLVAQQVADRGTRAERVQDGGDGAGAGFLVVEDGEAAEGAEEDEEREGFEPGFGCGG